MWQKLRNISPSWFVSTSLHKSLLQAKCVEYCMYIFSVLANQKHAFKTRILGTLQPCFYFLNVSVKALIWHKAEEYVLKQFGSIALHKSLLETKKIGFFYLNLVYELYNDNKPCPRTPEPPLPPRGTRIQKIGFVAPILKFPSAKVSKTINMLCKHDTTNVIIR